ncbi:LysR family transcriptional regulator [Actinobacillus equuli]|uniref:LysR family transcriptional regulator n=2 Tax=Actinobacillus equuli TaxID=718 RepID=UPI002442783E|nr:LysR family transcriptional regulator [Actinobacillus equuli]WGE79285.1 LysR family transcriptional regulator [Actinobacillus equuli subsp. equuli]
MEFRQFKYVLKVAEERNFSNAAKKLFISQPSLSQFIQKVEEEVGSPLFDRSVSPLKLTYVGELYVEKAKAIIDIQHQFEQKVDDILNVKRGRVTIGSTPFRSAYLLSRVLPLFSQQYPKIDIFLKEDSTRNLEEMVTHGYVDCAISLLPVNEKYFDYEILFEERMLLAIPPEHRIAQELGLKAGDHSFSQRVCLEQFKQSRFIKMNKNHKLHEMLIKQCELAGYVPEIALETESMTTAQALAGAGLGVALLPETLVSKNHFDKEPCYGELDIRRTVVIIYRKNSYLSRATRAFIQSLRELTQCPFSSEKM